MNYKEGPIDATGIIYQSVWPWVGRCESCGTRQVSYTGNALYKAGDRLGWSTTACCVTKCRMKSARQLEKPGNVVPLATADEQAPYVAAHAVGGDDAVWQMCGWQGKPK